MTSRLTPKVTTPGSVPPVANRIEGTVYDESGRPLPDADVQIIAREFLPASTRPIDRRFNEVTLATTVTDGAGKYSFPDLTPGEVKITRAWKSGYVAAFTEDVRVPAVHDFHLVTGTPVTGTVVNPATAQPIEGVGVKGWHASPGGTKYRWMEEVFTNRAGKYAFEEVPPGTVTFMLAHPEYLDQMTDRTVVAGARNDFPFEMQRGITLDGVVAYLKNDAPAAGVKVSVYETPVFARWTATTDSAGKFRITGVKTGKILFQITGRQVNPLKEQRDLTEANDASGQRPGQPLEFRVTPTGRAKGTILAKDGSPIPSAAIFVAPAVGQFVIVRDPTEQGGDFRRGEATTAEDGTFEIQGLTVAQHRVVAAAPGFALGVSDPFFVNPDDVNENVKVSLSRRPAVHGKIVSDAGGPVANVVVTAEIPQYAGANFLPAFDLGQAAQPSVVTNESGQYRFEFPYGCEVKLRAEHPDFVTERAEIAAKEGEPEVELDLTIKQAYSISGKVLTESGQPAAGARVRAWRVEDNYPIDAEVSPSGEYKIARLAAGEYRLTASQGDLVSDFRDEVPAGATDIDFTLTALGEIVGAVATPTGLPVTRFSVFAAPVGKKPADPQVRKPSTAGLTPRELNIDDPTGTFRIQKTEPATWMLHVTAEGYAPCLPIEVRVPGGSAATSAGTVVLKAGGMLRGKVVSPTGTGVEGVRATLSRVRNLPDQDLTAVPPAAARPKTGTSNAAGEFEVRGLFPGDWVVKLQSPSHVQPTAEAMRIEEGTPAQRTFVMSPLASLAILVKDDAGQPVAGALIQVLDQQKRVLPPQIEAEGAAATDANGSYRFKALPANDPIFIKVIRRGFLVVEQPQTLRQGDNGSLELRLQPIR